MVPTPINSPSEKGTVLSIGDVLKNDDGTMSEELFNVLDWSQGPRSRANEWWMVMIKKQTLKGIEEVSQEGINPRS